MTSILLLFTRLILRPLKSEPVRTALTVFAVALGVAVVIAIDLAGEAAAGSFHSSLESLTGKTDLIVSATGGLDEKLLADLVQLPYALDFAPRIEDFAAVEGRGEAVPFIGIDLIGHNLAQFDAQNPEQAALLLSASNPIWVGARLHLEPGARVHLLIDDALHEYTVAGVLKSQPGEIAEQNVIVADIGLAQLVTAKTGKLDTIDVHIPTTNSTDHWRQLIAAHVPASVDVAPQGTRTDENRKMLSAFRWNLRVLSYIALIVGAFLIYNTISVSVVRRRNEIGVLRALGATRTLIAVAFLTESLFFAIAGSLLGLVLGRIMAVGAVALIGKTIQSLYVSSEPSPIHLTLESAATGVALGVLVSLLAALAPAVEAAYVAPVEAMARGREEYNAAQRSLIAIWWGFLMLAIGAALTQAPAVHGQPIAAYLAVLLLIAGTASAIPTVVVLFSRFASQAIQRLLGTEAMLALRSLRASLGRTSVLTAALTTAVAMTASVGIMVGSFRQTLAVWMDNQLKADLYLRPAGSSSADRHPTMAATIADRIAQLPGVAKVDRFRAYPISYEGLPATLAGGESTSSTRFLPGENGDEILRTLPSGDYAIVSEPFANKHNVGVGSTIALPLAGAKRIFRVIGIYYDYSTERGYIILARHTLLKYLPDPDSSNLAVNLRAGADSNTVRQAIDRVIAGRAVLVFPNSTLRRGAIDIFDRTFRITYALEAIAISVAVMGIAGALLAMVIDRRREFAILRFLGAAQPQVRRVILFEAGLLGLLANTIGIILGTFLSLILIFVINKQSFGWTFQFHWPVVMLLSSLTVVYLATVLAGLYPARTALHMNPIEVVHEA
jgi:putative ABC transport system permease protein